MGFTITTPARFKPRPPTVDKAIPLSTVVPKRASTESKVESVAKQKWVDESKKPQTTDKKHFSIS